MIDVSEHDATVVGFWFAVVTFGILLPANLLSTVQAMAWIWGGMKWVYDKYRY